MSREAKDAQRSRKLLADMVGFLVSARRIVSRGEAAFFDPQDDTQRLAMTAIIINLSTAADRLPESFREDNAQVPWRYIRSTRNFLAHDYAGVNYRIIWNTALKSFPELERQIADMTAKLGGI